MTIVGFKPRNHPQQMAKRGGACDETDDRRTLPEHFAPWNARYRFTLDAAANDENALCSEYYTRERSGLVGSWSGHRVWCNPPFSSLATWVRKAHDEMRCGCELVCMLLPANRTEQRWWQMLVEPFRDRPPVDGVRLTTTFLSGRLRFNRPGWEARANGDRPPFGCVILVWERAS